MKLCGERRTTPLASNVLAQYAVFLEPGLHLIPGVFRGFLAVAGAIIGVEAVRRAGIDLELGGLLVGRKRFFHLLHLRDRNAGVSPAVKAEYRRLHIGRELERALRP